MELECHLRQVSLELAQSLEVGGRAKCSSTCPFVIVDNLHYKYIMQLICILLDQFCCEQVVLMNQVTLKVTGDTSKLVPALGESWSHACTNRVILFWDDAQRFCHLYKSPSLKAATAPFCITAQGIRSNSAESLKRQRGDGGDNT